MTSDLPSASARVNNVAGSGEAAAAPEPRAEAIAYQVPLLTPGQLGQFDDIASIYRASPAAATVPVLAPTSAGHAVAMRLEDDSMGERLPAGSVVVITDDRAPRDNDLVVGLPPGSNTPCLRTWVAVGERKFVVPIDENFPAREVKPGFRLYGVVVEATPATSRPAPPQPAPAG